MSYKIHEISSSSDECSIVEVNDPHIKLLTLSEDSDDSLPDLCKRILQKRNQLELNSNTFEESQRKKINIDISDDEELVCKTYIYI